jgi:hypothetical protein
MLIALGISTPIFADSTSPFAVTIPNQNGGLNIGADALYLQPSASNLAYGTLYNGNPSAAGANVSGTVETINPSYNWGFDANVGYRIPNTGNDVNLAWTHLGPASNSTTTIAPTNGVITNQYEHKFSEDSGWAQFNYDAADLDIGQRVMFGDYFNFHAFTGLRWADVKEQLANTGAPSDLQVEPAPHFHYTDEYSEFKGVGPQVGFDGRACLPYNFGLDASLTSSFLLGAINSTANSTMVMQQTGSSSTTYYNNHGNDHVVSALDGRLGLDYTINFNNADRSSMMVQAGYQVTNYFGVSNMIITNGVNSTNNIAFDGPYAGIKVMV